MCAYAHMCACVRIYKHKSSIQATAIKTRMYDVGLIMFECRHTNEQDSHFHIYKTMNVHIWTQRLPRTIALQMANSSNALSLGWEYGEKRTCMITISTRYRVTACLCSVGVVTRKLESAIYVDFRRSDTFSQYWNSSLYRPTRTGVGGWGGTGAVLPTYSSPFSARFLKRGII